jgi:tetratricopeptide (TPR) repeat protein
MKPMATKRMQPRARDWTVVLTMLLGLALFLLFLYRRAERPDALNEGRAAYARGQWSRAADLARQRLKSDGKDLAALRLLARSSIRLGRDGAGASIYGERLGALPLEPEDSFLLGLAASRQGDSQKALSVWSKACRELPEHPELLLSLANLLARMQRLDESSELARRLSLVPDWQASGLLLLGTNRFMMDDQAGAADALARGLQLDLAASKAPLDPGVYRKMLARCLISLGRPTDSDVWLEPLTAGAGNAPVDTEAAWLASRSALQQKQFDRFKEELARSGSYRASDPLTPEPSLYAGAARCGTCHSEISRAHAETRHSRTFHHGAELLSLARPSSPLADPADSKVTHTFVQDGTILKVRSNIESRIYEVVVDYAFGTKDRYLTMVGRDGEGGSRALRLSYFHEQSKSGWGPTAGDTGTAADRQSLRGQVVPLRDGVVRCLQCHVTKPREFRDPERIGRGPEAADAGIGCERCHGPGGNHIAAVEADLADHAIVNIGAGSGEAATQQCRDCHIVGDASEILNRREESIWVRSPGLTMTFSRCYTESSGALSCLTCHDPHRASERSASFYERKCLACHQPGRSGSGAGLQSNSRGTTCKVDPNGDCLNCHMPKVPMAVLHTSLTDHYIRVHSGDRDGQTK